MSASRTHPIALVRRVALSDVITSSIMPHDPNSSSTPSSGYGPEASHLKPPPDSFDSRIEIESLIGHRPYYLDFLANAVNHLLIVRSNAEYALHNVAKVALGASKDDAAPEMKKKGRINHAPRMLDVAKGSILHGNLAKLALSCDNSTWGVDWIAPSFKIRDALLKSTTSARSQVVLTAEGETINVQTIEIDNLKEPGTDEMIETTRIGAYQFDTIFHATCNDDDRRHDSEHLLLNYLQHLINNKKIQQKNCANGFLSIISERIPCSSCTNTIRDFLARNSWINLRLFYFHDTENRGASDFLTESGNKQIVAINKIALSSTVHVIPVENDARIVLGETVREQYKMFGGAPNQIVSMVNPSHS